MGSYAQLSVNGYELLSVKSYIPPELLTIYSESDRYEEDEVLVEDPEEPEVYRHYYYRTNVGMARKRLDVMGFTFAKARRYYQEGLDDYLRGRVENWTDDGMSEDAAAAEADKLRLAYSIDNWVKAVKAIVRYRVEWHTGLRSARFPARRNLPPAARASLDDLEPITSFIFDYHEHEADFGYLGTPDIRYALREILDCFKPSATVELEFSALVAGGWLYEDTPLVTNAWQQIAEARPHGEKVVVLTEGSSDRRVLELSLRMLHPDMVHFFSFPDFSATNVAGGAPALVNLLRAFVAMGMTHRVVAVFDNDTAAREAVAGLSQIKLPANIGFTHLPYLPLAKKYPTLGPQGAVSLDVNGLAGSLELYSGKDILRDESGNLTPVQWAGYCSKLKSYQGEVIDKKRIQEKCIQMLQTATSINTGLPDVDWSGFRLVWKHIFEAVSHL